MDNDSVYTIYGLKDPRTDLVRYIGITVNHPTVRLKEHLKKAHQLNTPKDHWLCQLQHLGLKPSVVILAFAADAVEAKAIEKLWIQSEFASGWELTNSDHLTSSYDMRKFQTGIFRVDERTTPHWADWLRKLLSELIFAFSPLTGSHTPYPGERHVHSEDLRQSPNDPSNAVDADGWVVTSPQHRQALGLSVNNVVPAAGVTEYLSADIAHEDDIERVDPRSVRQDVRPAPLPRRPQAAPEPPTLTEKQEKVFAYFEANARYDKVKQAWIFPTVVVMAKETGCAGSYVQGLKVEWLENKALDEHDDTE